MYKPLILAATIAAAVVCSAISTAVYARGPATDCPHIFGSNSRPRVATTDQASGVPLLCFSDGAAVVDTKKPRKALHQSGVLPFVRAVLARC
jgi:hypothetical protein